MREPKENAIECLTNVMINACDDTLHFRSRYSFVLMDGKDIRFGGIWITISQARCHKFGVLEIGNWFGQPLQQHKQQGFTGGVGWNDSAIGIGIATRAPSQWVVLGPPHRILFFLLWCNVCCSSALTCEPILFIPGAFFFVLPTHGLFAVWWDRPPIEENNLRGSLAKKEANPSHRLLCVFGLVAYG